MEDDAGEHDLHVFEAFRRLDAVLVHNFMLFDEVVEDGRHDLVIGDEAWEVDHFLHENPDLHRHLAACDLAVVQGGLTTCMELTAARRPFLYVPLRNHFEQNFHVRHRLDRYGAGRRMDFETDGPERIADAIAAEIGRSVSYREVDTGGAARAAALISDLL